MRLVTFAIAPPPPAEKRTVTRFWVDAINQLNSSEIVKKATGGSSASRCEKRTSESKDFVDVDEDLVTRTHSIPSKPGENKKATQS